MKNPLKALGIGALLLVVGIAILGAWVYVALCTGHPHGMC